MLRSVHRLPKQPTNDPPVLVMLHGRGTDEHDLLGLQEYLDPRFEIHSLRAPFEYEWGGYTWFRMSDALTPVTEDLQNSLTGIRAFIDALPSKKVFLLGFSMGAILSYALTLRDASFCRGVAALSGFAPEELSAKWNVNALASLPYFVSHGTGDPIIPIERARRTNEILSATSAIVTYREYPMGHQISAECLADLNAWFAPLLA